MARPMTVTETITATSADAKPITIEEAENFVFAKEREFSGNVSDKYLFISLGNDTEATNRISVLVQKLRSEGVKKAPSERDYIGATLQGKNSTYFYYLSKIMWHDGFNEYRGVLRRYDPKTTKTLADAIVK